MKLLPLSALLLASHMGSMIVSGQETQQESGLPQPAIPVERDTTFVAGPLDELGYVDYVQALRQSWKEGVSPENNAAVLLWRAWGPTRLPKSVDRASFFADLEVEPLATDGDYFVPLEPHGLELAIEWLENQQGRGVDSTAAQKEVDRIYKLASGRPWRSEQIPPLAQWLDINAKPLDLIVAASKLPKYYNPVVLVRVLHIWGSRLLSLKSGAPRRIW